MVKFSFLKDKKKPNNTFGKGSSVPIKPTNLTLEDEIRIQAEGMNFQQRKMEDVKLRITDLLRSDIKCTKKTTQNALLRLQTEKQGYERKYNAFKMKYDQLNKLYAIKLNAQTVTELHEIKKGVIAQINKDYKINEKAMMKTNEQVNELESKIEVLNDMENDVVDEPLDIMYNDDIQDIIAQINEEEAEKAAEKPVEQVAPAQLDTAMAKTTKDLITDEEIQKIFKELEINNKEKELA